jgi:hypothetical protein
MPAAKASIVTYNVILQNTSGPESRTGFLNVEGPIASSGQEIISSGIGLKLLSFSIAGNDCTLANAMGTPNVVFQDGALAATSYTGILDPLSVSFTLASGLLNYIYNDSSDVSHRTFGRPLPGALRLFATGLRAMGCLAGG